MALIAVYNSDGCVGRCDARCYNATGEKCDCICGGMNHGCKETQAVENTKEMAETLLEQYHNEHPNQTVEIKLYKGENYD